MRINNPSHGSDTDAALRRSLAETLGIEPERRADFKRWSDAFIEGSTGAGRERPFAPEFTDAVLEFTSYLRATVRRRRRAPGDDLVSTILADAPGVPPLPPAISSASINRSELFKVVLNTCNASTLFPSRSNDLALLILNSSYAAGSGAFAVEKPVPAAPPLCTGVPLVRSAI